MVAEVEPVAPGGLTPSHLVVLASERLWPQLDALAHWGDGLDELHVLVMHGDEDDGGPADRLETFARAGFPDLKVFRHGPFNDDETHPILEVLDGLITDDAWALDGSGASRLVFAGLAQHVDRYPGLTFLYRDAEGPWFRLGPGGISQRLAGFSRDAMDRFTVEALLAVTWNDEERDARVLRRHVRPQLRSAANLVWDGAPWRPTFDKAVKRLGLSQADAGFAFEEFILALVRRMGVDADDVTMSVALQDGLVKLQEVDLVVNSRGRLHVIDCKLGEGGPKKALLNDQIRVADATRRYLGDASDQFILLRPNLVLFEEQRRLAAEYGIRVVDKSDIERSSLGEVLHRLLRGVVE